MKSLTTEDIVEVKGHFALKDSGAFPSFIDSWKKQKSPTPENLLAEYERYGYVCANLNVTGMLNSKLRLYTNKTGNRKGSPIDLVRSKRLVNNPRLKLHLASQATIEEITEHPFLDLWHSPNPLHDACDFLSLYGIYKEIIGAAYVKFVPNNAGTLQEWWILPSQNIKPIKDKGHVVGFKFGQEEYPNKPTGNQPYIIAFPNANPHDPYGGVGLSPLRAAFESVTLESKMLATEAAILDNDGRPSGILSPKESIGEHEARRWEQRYNAKFRQGGAGTVMVTDEDVNFQPLTFPPKDLAALQIRQASKADIALAFGIPTALLESNQFNRATLEASIIQHVRQAIWPRLRDFEAKINKHVVSLYGPDLFVAFDDPNPESKDLKAAYLTTLVGGQIITPNEARLELDYKPLPEGEELRVMPGQEVSTQEVEETSTEPTEIPEQEPAAAALNGAQIQSLIDLALNLANQELPPDSVRGLIAAAFPSLTPQQINAIVNPLLGFEPPKEEEAASSPIGEQEPPEPQQEPEPATEDGKSLVILNQKAVGWVQPPSSDALEKLATKFFKKYRASALSQLKKDVSANVVRKDFQALDTARDELAADAQPIIEIFMSEGAKELIQRVGVDPDIFDVTNPEVKEAIEQAAFDFADSTNQATTMSLNDAIDKLREQLGDSLDAGARLHEMTSKVNEIFDSLEKHQAKLIAQTEASRAHHEGQRAAAIESGIVKGFELLLSPDACPVCVGVFNKNKRIGLDGYFVEGEGVYGNRLVPIHPNCRCTMLEVLDIQA